MPFDETSYPVGGVTVRLAVKRAPATVKVCTADAKVGHVKNAVVVPLTVIVGPQGLAFISAAFENPVPTPPLPLTERRFTRLQFWSYVEDINV